MENISIEETNSIKKDFDYDLQISPELWAARNGHRIYCGDFRQCSFDDKDFEKWIHRVYDILHTENLQEWRKQYLTPEEINTIEDEEMADFE